MALEIQEQQQSRSINVTEGGATQKRLYYMKNYTESEQAWLALLNYAPEQVYMGNYFLTRGTVSVEIEFSDPESTLYRGVVEYLSPTLGGQPNKKGGGGGKKGENENKPTGKKQDDEDDPVEEEDPASIFFTFGTKTVTMLQAINQQKWTKEDGFFPLDPKGNDLAINRSAGDVAPEGVEIPQGTMHMHVRFVKPEASMTASYYFALRSALYSVNANKWGISNPFICQFQGAEITRMKSGDSKVEYKFELGDGYNQAKEIQTSAKDTNWFRTSDKFYNERGSWNSWNYPWFSWNEVGKDTKIGGVGEDDAEVFVKNMDSCNLAQVYPIISFNGKKDIVFGHMNKAAKVLDPKWIV